MLFKIGLVLCLTFSLTACNKKSIESNSIGDANAAQVTNPNTTDTSVVQVQQQQAPTVQRPPSVSYQGGGGN